MIIAAPATPSAITGEKPAMIKSILYSVSVLALVIAASPAVKLKDDCETRMKKLDASPAEGAERLAEKNAVIDYCANQYKHDKAVDRLVRQCAKYEKQPIIKQQFVAECMLAAYNYAHTLYALKAEYGK